MALKNKKQEQKKVIKVSHKQIIIIFSAKVVFTFIRGKPKTHSSITVGSDIHYPREASKTSSTAPFREMSSIAHTKTWNMEHPTTRHTNKTMRKNLSYFKSCRSSVLFYFTYNQVLHVLQVCSRIPSFNTCRKLRVEV